MADNAFDRAFNRALLSKNLAEDRVRSGLPLSQAQKDAKETEALRSETAPMKVDDAIKRMLLADKDKDYFRYTSALAHTCATAILFYGSDYLDSFLNHHGSISQKIVS